MNEIVNGKRTVMPDTALRFAKSTRDGAVMKGINPPTSAQRAYLEAFLTRSDLPEQALTYRQLQGFLFAMTSAPELVQPSEWIPRIFGDEEPVFEDEEDVERVMGAVMDLYNDINLGVLEGSPRLPADCALRDDPMANLEPDAPIGEWCEGFRQGHLWLEESWDQPLDEDMENELEACLTPLAFFASRSMAEALWEENADPGTTLEMAAEVFHRLFADAMAGYATVGRWLYEALYDEDEGPHVVADPVEVTVAAGRNDPCPCGSGRKYKKCCGRNVH